ncbi:hypothetical protein [Isoptericola sp. NPDC055881]
MGEPRRTIDGYTGRGYLALVAALLGVVLSIVSVSFVTWVADRAERAARLVAEGERALASSAEVYRCRGRCADDFVAVVEFPGGPRRVEIVDVDFDRNGLTEGRWFPAPAPYDEPFSVLYDPEDEMSMMTEIDALVSSGDIAPWGVVWTCVAWTLVWAWPAFSATRSAVRRDREDRSRLAAMEPTQEPRPSP